MLTIPPHHDTMSTPRGPRRHRFGGVFRIVRMDSVNVVYMSKFNVVFHP
jgi:hypothetical protein